MKTKSKEAIWASTLRLPKPLYQSVLVIANERQTSINRLAQEALERLVEDEAAARLRAAYDEIGAAIEDTDVERFFKAQREVVIHDPD